MSEVVEAEPKVTLKFALAPWEEEEVDGYKNIMVWLADYTGYEIQPIQVKDYQHGVDLVASGGVDLAALGAGGFVAAEQINPGVKMLVTQSYWNGDKNRGCFILYQPDCYLKRADGD